MATSLGGRARQSVLSSTLRILVGFAFVVSGALVGLSWAHLSAPGSSPDDDYHAPSIICPPPIERSGCQTFTATDEKGRPTIGAYVPQQDFTYVCYLHTKANADCLADLSRTPVQTTRLDKGEYPGPYYRLMSRVWGERDVFAGTMRVRATNVVIAVAAFAAVALAGTPATRRLLAWSMLATMVPLGLFLIASINPSAWSIIGVPTMGLALYSLLHVRSGWRPWANAALVVGGATLASVARTDAGPFIAAASGVLVLTCWRQALRRPWRLLALVPAWAVGVWSFYTGQGSRAVGAQEPHTSLPTDFLVWHNLMEYPRMAFGIYGYSFGLGWFDVTVPAVTVVGGIAVASLVLTAGLRSLSWAKVTAWLLLAAFLVALPLYMLGKDKILLGSHIQPRYFLPLVPALFVVALVGRRTATAITLSLRKRLVAQLVLVLAQAAALFATARRYLNGLEVDARLNLDAPSRWWWPEAASPWTWWWTGTIAFAVLTCALHAVSRSPRQLGGAHLADVVD